MSNLWKVCGRREQRSWSFPACTNPVNVGPFQWSRVIRYQLTFCFIELNQITGIAAILTFPLDVEVVEAEEALAKAEEEQRHREQAGDKG
jgi:hypothetical protein